MQPSCQTAVKLKENVSLQLLGLFGFWVLFLREREYCSLCFVLSAFPAPSLDGIPIKEIVLCAVGLVPFHYVSVSLDENLMLCVAQVSLIKGEKTCLESLKLVYVSILPSALPFECSEVKVKKKKGQIISKRGKEFCLVLFLDIKRSK